MITKDNNVETVDNSIVMLFRAFFKIQYLFLALSLCMVSCEECESFENKEFSTSIPKGSIENGLSTGFNGFTYRYCFTTPDNQEIGIEIVPWRVELPELLNSFINYKFPHERKRLGYFNRDSSFNSFTLGLNIGIDCEIYEDDDLLDGWCYAFHSINGESVCIYTYARSGHCSSIKRLIKDFKIKKLPKHTTSSLWVRADNLVCAWIKKQYPNSTIYFTQPTTLKRGNSNIHLRGTECGIMVMMNDNMLNGELGIRIHTILHTDNYLNFVTKILDRDYLINFKYPDNTIEVPLIY